MVTENEIIVDGQKMAIPSLQAWNGFLECPVYKGAPVYTKNTENIVRNLIQITTLYPDCFCLGLYKTKHFAKSWSVMPLLKLNEKWHRVQIEHVSCLACEWSGRIANSTEPSIYFTIPDQFAALRKASSLRRLPCPKCGAELPRHAVWTEQKNL